MIRTKELLGAITCQIFSFVDNFAASVITTTGIALCVLVCEYRSLGSEHRLADDVLTGDEVDLSTLALFFTSHDGSDIWV